MNSSHVVRTMEIQAVSLKLRVDVTSLSLRECNMRNMDCGESISAYRLWSRTPETKRSGKATTAGRWSLLLALLPLAVCAPARADAPCSGGDEVIARPIAETIQSHVLDFNPAGRFEVSVGPAVGASTPISVRHLLGNRVMFQSTSAVDASPDEVILQPLPTAEGRGFAVRVTAGGSGYYEVCVYGFRFQNGSVSYRMLAAMAKNHNSAGTWAGVPTAWKPAPIASVPTAVTAASINVRITRLRNIEAMQLPYLYESTSVMSDISIVARDLPVRLAGFKDYRALYDQLYFASIQYSGLASRWIKKGQTASNRGDLGSATLCLDNALRLLQQKQTSYDAAVAVANKDLKRATTYVQTTYTASKWAAGIVASAAGVPGGSGMIDAAGGLIDFALNMQDGGLKSASASAITDILVYVISDVVKFPDLGGRTLKEAVENRTGKLLASDGVIATIHDGIQDAGIRKVIIDSAKSLLHVAPEAVLESEISLALDKLRATEPSSF